MAEGSVASHSHNTLLYVFALIYLCVLVVVAVVAYRRKSAAASTGGKIEAHFGGSFSTPALILTTFSTLYSGFTVTGVPSEAYHQGFVSLRWIGSTLVIVVSMLLFYPRLRRLAVERRYQSPNDFVTDRYRSMRLRLLCAVCGVIPLAIYLTAQVVSFAAMVSGLTLQAVPKWASAVGFAVVTLMLEKLGGMKSVVLTDAVQSVVMIASFLVVPWILGFDFGFLSEIAPPDCVSLDYVSANASSPNAVPGSCPAPAGAAGPAPGCVPAGCLAAVRPDFYQYPSRADQAGIFWFLFNMLAFSLQPHMIQRTYIAKFDRALKIAMASLLVAPFLAQPPGIIIGLTKAAFDPGWPKTDQEATAFTGLSNQLEETGPFECFLVTVMTCACLAAIMSTADSVLMGASSVVSIDIFKGWLLPSASADCIVRLGEVNSLLMMTVAVLLGLNISVSQFGSLLLLQNGMLMQLMPTFGLGLYFDICEIALTCGMAIGLLVLVVLAASGNPLDPYVPLINVSFLANLAVVGVIQLVSCLQVTKGRGGGSKSHEVGTDFNQQDALTLGDIRAVMAPSAEPRRPILLLMLCLMVASVPFYRAPGSADRIIWGMPLWGFIQCVLFAAVFLLGQVATGLWVPRGRFSGSGEKESVTDGTDVTDINSSSLEEPSDEWTG